MEDFGHITQIERVVELGRDGQHSAAHLQVHVNRGLHRDTRLQLVVGLLSIEEPTKNLLKDQRECILSRLGYVHDLEVSHEARREGLSTSTRRCRSTNHCELLYVLPFAVLAIIVAFLVNELSKKLDRGLGTVELFLRHVDVINEDETLSVALDRAKDILSLFLKFGIDVLLSSDTLSLR